MGCILTLGVLMLLVTRPALFSHMEQKIFDVLLSRTTPREPSRVPVLIAIDDPSLTALGQWPWPRHLMARLVTRLHEAEADMIVLDMVLATPDRTSPLSVRNDLLRDQGLTLRLDGLPEERIDYDLVLAQTLQQVPAILGYKLLFSPRRTDKDCALHTLIQDQPPHPYFDLHQASDLFCNLPILGRAAKGSGFINALPDTDGVLRRVPVIALVDGNLVPSLALAAFRAGQESVVGLGRDLDGGFVQIGKTRVHTDAQGNMLLRYRGPRGSYQTISAADLLHEPLPDLKGRVAILGPTAAGLGDTHVTPLDRFCPGIEIHATMLDNLLANDALIRPDWAVGAEAFVVMAVGALTILLLLVAGPLLCVLSLAAGSLILWEGSLWLLDGPGYWISPLSGEIILLVNVAVLSLIKYGLEERELRIRTQQLVQAQDATILSLTALAETRDPETGGHINRTRDYVQTLAANLAGKPKFRAILTPEVVQLLHKSAPLHDIGKVGISDSILLKPGPLTAAEYKEMQRHTTLGAHTLAEAERQAFDHASLSYLSLAREIALTHHEKWDGSGYPQGLKGDDIPLGGRLMALADVYDALISKRVYKDAMSHSQAVEIIVNGRGSHFDPDVVDAFLESEQIFLEISIRYE